MTEENKPKFSSVTVNKLEVKVATVDGTERVVFEDSVETDNHTGATTRVLEMSVFEMDEDDSDPDEWHLLHTYRFDSGDRDALCALLEMGK